MDDTGVVLQSAFNHTDTEQRLPWGLVLVCRVDAAVQTESTVAPPQAASVAQQLEVGGAAGTAGAAVAVHSTPSDMLTVLQAQLEEKDKVIADLRVSAAAGQCVCACFAGVYSVHACF